MDKIDFWRPERTNVMKSERMELIKSKEIIDRLIITRTDVKEI